MQILENAKEWWHKLPGHRRQKITMWSFIGAASVIAFGAYYFTGRGNDDKKVEPEIVEKVNRDEQILKQDYDAYIQNLIKREIANAKLSPPQQQAVVQSVAALPEIEEDGGDYPSAEADTDREVAASLPEYPQAPPAPGLSYYDSMDYASNTQNQEEYAEPEIIGDVEVLTFKPVKQDTATTPAKGVGSEHEGKVYLGVGFMPAKLLVGIDAMTTQSGQQNPETILLRVQAPATLPNKIKMDVQGCFAVANAWGNLAKERIQAQTVSMHCLTMDGKKAVEGELRGFVADKDGKRDMAGIVVSRAGSLLASSVLANTISGIGNSVQNNVGTQSISPLGVTKTFDAKDSLQAGAGEGFGKGLSDVGKLILDLAKQASPVIEAGAAKEVMIMVQEPTWLEIKDIRG
jgi:conjugal transfer pilus assembly protein TraB